MPEDVAPLETSATPATAVPRYLHEIYWWAYVHPRAIAFFERQWLVNAILWGNFAQLRDAALDRLGESLEGRTLQVACVYGDFTNRLASRLAPGASLDVIDVLPQQLDNLKRKLPQDAPVTGHVCDSAALRFADATHDRTILFFLLHEQPENVRRRTLAEAVRVTRPGGRIVVVDYHLPSRLHPLRYLFRPVLKWLEPFALDLWDREIAAWMPDAITPDRIVKRTAFGGLYQLLEIRV